MKRKGQLKFQDRVKIELFIKDEIPVSVICKKLNVSKQTIYREIQRNCVTKKANYTMGVKCAHRLDCPRRVSDTFSCSSSCEHYIPYECPTLKRFPFVCNNCQKKNGCRDKRVYYYANAAQKLYEKNLHESRKGIRISQDDFEQINETISPLIKEKKQSLNHILTSHTEIDVSERTLRNWINLGYTDAKNIDLPRKVSFKPSKDYIHRITKPADIIDGRSYRDFRQYIKDNPNLLVAQLDTVEGKKSDVHRVLTIHFPSIHFQFGILLDCNSPQEVNRKLLDLRNKMGLESWKKIFPVILTDNGIEFNALPLLESDPDSTEHLTSVFYCNPYCSSQKGACERNHEFFRYIEPKYTSLDHLDQNKVNLIFSNINSLYRSSLNGVRPIDLAEAVLGTEFLNIIGIKKIEPDAVNLSQSLVKTIKQR